MLDVAIVVVSSNNSHLLQLIAELQECKVALKKAAFTHDDERK